MTKKTIADWQALAEKELKRPADALTWHTPEGIDVKPLYTADDIAGIEHLDSLPGSTVAAGLATLWGSLRPAPALL